jgi:hypothetical protein
MEPQEYFLSKSVLRLSLDQFVVQNEITGSRTTVYEGTAAIVDVADTVSPRSVQIPDTHRANTSSTVVFRDDRRLSSLETSSTGQGPVWVKAGIGIAGTVVGVVISVANPLAGLGLVAAGAAASTKSLQALRAAFAEDGPPSGGVEESAELKAYGVKFPDAKKVLLQLTVALRELAEEIGERAGSAPWENLEELGARRKLIAEQLMPLQSHFASWVLSKNTKKLVDRREVSIDVGDLPTEEQFEQAIARDRWWDESGPSWLRWARDAGIAVTVDYEDASPQEEDHSHEEVCLEYRAGRAAFITTWAVSRVRKPAHIDDGGNEIAEMVSYSGVPQSRVHRRVVATDSPVRHFDLDVDLFKSGKLSVKFNELGEVSELGGEHSRLVAETAASVPESVEGAVERGGKISAALIPGTTSAARLKNALEVAKNRKELDPLINPSTPDAEAQAKAELEAEVTIAELEARMALARQLASYPSAGVVVHEFGSQD